MITKIDPRIAQYKQYTNVGIFPVNGKTKQQFWDDVTLKEVKDINRDLCFIRTYIDYLNWQFITDYVINKFNDSTNLQAMKDFVYEFTSYIAWEDLSNDMLFHDKDFVLKHANDFDFFVGSNDRGVRMVKYWYNDKKVMQAFANAECIDWNEVDPAYLKYKPKQKKYTKHDYDFAEAEKYITTDEKEDLSDIFDFEMSLLTEDSNPITPAIRQKCVDSVERLEEILGNARKRAHKDRMKK